LEGWRVEAGDISAKTLVMLAVDVVLKNFKGSGT
jgi:hypothetical protein